MKLTFNRNILIGFALSLAILIISSVASYFSINNLLRSYNQVRHTNQVIQNLDAALSAAKDLETGQRGFLLTGEPRYLEPFVNSRSLVFEYIDKAKALTTDNAAQQEGCIRLRELAMKRVEQLDFLIEQKKKNVVVTPADLDIGKKYMDETRILVKILQEREDKLLDQRTTRMNRFAAFTPVLIVLAAVLALIITVIFYLRVKKDFQQNTELQRELQRKDEDITHRIEVIRNIANRISAGDYSIRVGDEGRDGLGDLSFSMNKMAASLQYSFQQLSEKDWLQTGMNKLNEQIAGEQELKKLANSIISFTVNYTQSQVGSLYLLNEDDILELTGNYGLHTDNNRRYIPVGSGIIGQTASDMRMTLLENIPEDYIRISFASAEITPRNIITIPILFNNQLKGVIEIGTVYTYTKNTMDLLPQLAERVGIVLNTTLNRIKQQELFEEIQAQSEELQSQHSELENLNTELEAQAQRLQASEEELKEQREELMQANQELEERSDMLEERNQQIGERNREIQENAAQLELSTKYKSEFLANMSHELRTPLNSILLLSRLMSENADQNLSAEQVEYAAVIQSSGNGLLALIDEILDLSKIESGKMELEYADVSLAEIMRDMQGLFLPIAKQKNLSFRLDLRDDLPLSICTDKQRLEQILKNLLSNALKFTSEGYVQLQVSLAADHSSISFSVRDTGIGIPSEKQKAIFEAFQQADGSTRRKYGGTGLGLSISRELTKLLGGVISLTSEPGSGSEFTISIPVDQPNHMNLPDMVGNPVAEDEILPQTNTDDRFTLAEIPEATPDDRNHIHASGKTILIVEDDIPFAKALLDFTRKRGYNGIICVRGDEALPLAITYKPVAILLDIQLPVQNGWQVMDALKSNTLTRHIPVHIMSSFEARKESLMKGAANFIDKPVATEQLKEIFITLEDVLNKQHKKVLIVEENTRHAKALAYFLESFDVRAEISNTLSGSMDALHNEAVDCVILDMGIPAEHGYETLETIKQNPGMEDLPVIIFTGRNLSKTEAQKIKRYADSIVLKTAHSYQRILDEVSLFLHLMEGQPGQAGKTSAYPDILREVLHNKTILITDDDVRNIYSISKALEKHQMKILSATDGKEALRMLEEHPETDIVLMDIMMPEMDGYETMRRIRLSPALQSIPVIAVTAKAMTGDREKCVQAGASDYISKPVDMDQLTSLLRVWLYDKA